MQKTLLLSALLLAGTAFGAAAQQPSLDIYFIDVEGGAATLIVTPSRQSVLMDAGYRHEGRRDAIRILAAMRDAGITAIDYFIASHFHPDHVGGLADLTGSVPIGQFIDHGDSVEQDTENNRQAWETYLGAARGNRRQVSPGDRLALTGAEFAFVVANREIANPPEGPQIPNPHCLGASPGEDLSGENSRSLGYMLTVGDFQFLNLGDLTVNIQHELACPVNRLGVVDLLLVPHHGNGVGPQLTRALAPTAAVSNNGPHKGGGAEGYDAVATIPGIKAIWQVHRALDSGDAHNTTAQLTANLTEENDAGYWIKASVAANGGSFTLVNARNGYSETYATK